MSQADATALKDFLQQVSTMKVHRSARYGVAKKKQLFVLLLIARIGNRRLASNRVHFSDVEEELGDLISRFGGRSETAGPNPEQPFFHLSSSPFWKVHLAEQTVKNAPATPSLRIIRHPDTFGSLSQEIFELLSNSPAAREAATHELLTRWWPEMEAAEVRKVLFHK